jgi:DNA repair exonuclease SbcCD ATPase subunit
LKDFMTYASHDGSPTSFDFEGAILWSLAGRNGAGKSAIFDAITWSLFDEHRGGRRGHQRLIRSGAGDAVVRFEFQIRGQTYRITRTLRRRGPRATQTWQADRLNPLSSGWEMVPNTDHENGFARFVSEELRLRYPTFIASTLLLQGRSDALIAAEPKSRFEILSGVLDLAYYAEVSERAEERARDQRALLKAREAELMNVPVVSADELKRTVDGELAARGLLQGAETRLGATRDALTGAERYAEVSRRLVSAADERKAAEVLLNDATVIRSQFEEFSQLQAALPAAREAASRLDEADALDAEVAADTAAENSLDLAGLREKAARATAALDDATRRERDAREQSRDCENQFRAAEDQLSEVLRYERLLTDIDRVVAEQTPIVVELEGEASARSEIELLRCLRDALPLLQAVWAAEALVATREADAEKVGGEEDANRAIASARQSLEKLESALAALQRDRERLRDSEAAARAQVDSATAALRNRQQAASESVCSLCGQIIDAEQAATEVARAEVQVTEAGTAWVADQQRLTAVAAQVGACIKERDRAQVLLATAEHASTEAAVAAERVDDARRNLEGALQRLASAPDGVRGAARRVSLATIPQSRAAVAQIPTLEGELGRLQRARGRLDGLADRASTLRAEADQLDRTMPAAERARRRTALATLTQERTRLLGSVAETTATQIEARKRATAATRAAEIAEGQALTYRQRIAQRLAEAQAHRAAATARLADRPTWQEQVTARRGLVATEIEKHLGDLADAPVRHQQLKGAEDRVEAARAIERTLQAQLAEIPEAHRQPVTDAEAARDAAEAAQAAAASALDTARAAVQHLTGDRDRRTRLELAVSSAISSKRISATLAELLDRKHLQAHLVERALTSIQHLANLTLAAISRGELRLYLELQAKAGEQEVVIDATDYTSADGRLDVRFLSGGQKFRVAVAIAAAVGQFMGEGAPVGALIIDEGFGSLDAEGRIEMIAALHALAEHMQRVIVVSHHEEFQDRSIFPSGYLIEKIGHRTTARRFV